MADKLKKVDKEYALSDSTVNDYGFRVLTSGYQLSEYEKNPIGYYMHLRNDGVVVRWEDLRIEGDTLYGKPAINLSNPRGQQTLDEVESGFLNAASVGHLVILEVSNDESLKLPGQTGPTVTKWYNRECSLVDIGSNLNAITSLYSIDGKEIKLADLSSLGGATIPGTETKDNQNLNSIIMNEIKIALPDLAAAGFTAVDAAGLIAQMKELKLKADTALSENVTLKGANVNLQISIDTLKGDATKKEIDGMLDVALKAGKITAPVQTQLASVYAGKPELLKIDLESRGAYTPLAASLAGAGGGTQGEFEELQKMKWDDMHKSNKLPNLKSKFPELYKEKYKEKYGVFPS